MLKSNRATTAKYIRAVFKDMLKNNHRFQSFYNIAEYYHLLYQEPLDIESQLRDAADFLRCYSDDRDYYTKDEAARYIMDTFRCDAAYYQERAVRDASSSYRYQRGLSLADI